MGQYPWRKRDVYDYFSRPAEDLDADLQRRFMATIDLAWERIPFFRKKWTEAGLAPGDIRSTADLHRLPTTTIHDMRASIESAPPYGEHWAVGPEDCDSVMTTGGTTGFPRPVLVTREDIGRITDIGARIWSMAGVGRGDVAQVMATYSTHGAAWIAHWGLQRVGALIVPASSGVATPTVRQLDFIERFGVTTAYCTATYARILAEASEARGIDPRDLGIRKFVGLGEILSPSKREALETTWNAKAYDLYGTMETLAWSSVDCEASRDSHGALGMHIWSDSQIIEILDENGEPCAPGEYGDLTFTSWVSLAGPKVRYRMGDRAALVTDPCPCGLNTPRLLPLAGRVDDMLRIRSQNIWPAAIEDTLRRAAPEVGDWIAVAEQRGSREVLTLHVETTALELSEDISERVVREFKAATGVKPEITVVPIGGTAERSGAGKALKARRIFDDR